LVKDYKEYEKLPSFWKLTQCNLIFLLKRKLQMAKNSISSLINLIAVDQDIKEILFVI